MITVDSRYYDRETALLAYKGVLYEDYNHQLALEQAFNTEGKTLGATIMTNPEDYVDATRGMSIENEIGTFDVYVGDVTYIVGHTKENLVAYYTLIESYARQIGASIGYFTEFTNHDFVVIEDVQELKL